MSPEQARGSEVDHRSDLFSLGSVLYFMCTGHSPFRAKTTMGVLHRITSSDPSHVCQINADVPDWLKRIIDRLLAKDRSQRFQTAEEVASVLSEWLAYVQQPDVASRPAPPAVVTRRSKSQGPNIRVRNWTAVAASFFLILAGILITLEWNKGTLTIECVKDDVPVRIMKEGKVHKKLTVDRGATSTRISAGKYVVEIDGETDQLEVKDGAIMLSRRGAVLAKIVEWGDNEGAKLKTAESSDGNHGQRQREFLGEWMKNPDANMGPVQIEFLEGMDVTVVRGKKEDVERATSIIESLEETEATSSETNKGTDSRAAERTFEIYRVNDGNAKTVLQVLATILADSDVRIQLDEPDRILVYGRAEQHKTVRTIIGEISESVNDSLPTDESTDEPNAATTTQRMTIHVVDADGKPIEDATVFRNHVYTPPGSEKPKIENARFVTDNEGAVVVNLSAESVDLRLWATKEGFVPLHAMWSAQFQADGDQIPTEFTFELRPGTEIGGSVVDDAGRPIPGVKVEVKDTTVDHATNPSLPGLRPVRAYNLAEGDAVITDSQGRWSLNNVPSDAQLSAVPIDVFFEDQPPLVLRFTHSDFVRNEWGSLQREQDITLESLRAKSARTVLQRIRKKTDDDAKSEQPASATYNSRGAYWSYGKASKTETSVRKDEFIDGDWRYRLVTIVHPSDSNKKPFALLRGVNLHTGEVVRERLEHGKRAADYAVTIPNANRVHLYRGNPERAITLWLRKAVENDSKSQPTQSASGSEPTEDSQPTN